MSACEPIICFQHCKKENILCLKLPKQCPVCGGDISRTPMQLPPFRLPSPFSAAKSAPFSIVIKPTQGTFLQDYTSSRDLHIGITDSRGTVYDYDSDGLKCIHSSTESWSQCLATTTVSLPDQDRALTWDTKLQEYAMQPDWTLARYDQDQHNCYDFVLSFLEYAGMKETYPAVKNKTEFCEEFLIPKTTQAARYISLYRTLLEKGTLVQNDANRRASVEEECESSDL